MRQRSGARVPSRRVTGLLTAPLALSSLLALAGCDWGTSSRPPSPPPTARAPSSGTPSGTVPGAASSVRVVRRVERSGRDGDEGGRTVVVYTERGEMTLRLDDGDLGSDGWMGPGTTESRRVADAGGPGPSDVTWRPLFDGIEHAEIRSNRPRQMTGQALRIDVTRPGIEFFTTPSNGDAPSETDGLKTSSFLEKYGLKAAINAAPFWPIHSREGVGVDVKGLQICGGELVSPSDNSYPAILIDANNRAEIQSRPRVTPDIRTAVAGYHIVLEDGEVTGRRSDVHPRVSVGVSRDKQYIYMLVIDGRQGGHSIGATTYDVGDWLRQLGAWDGLNLDGGGTSTMVVADERGRARQVNIPFHNNIRWNERVSGSHLGVRAQPLPADASGGQ